MNKLIALLVVLFLFISSCIDETTEVFSIVADAPNVSLMKDADSIASLITKQSPEHKIKAYHVMQRSTLLNDYLENLKERIITASGGKDESGMARNDADIDAATKIMVEQKSGDTLKNMIAELRSFMLQQVSNADSIGSAITLKTVAANGHADSDWARDYFYHMPVVAAVTIFNKFQNDVRSSELVILNRILEESRSATSNN